MLLKQIYIKMRKILNCYQKNKKNGIEKACECFNNEKYYFEKFKNYPNLINYIEFLEDDKYVYIVYEYIKILE